MLEIEQRGNGTALTDKRMKAILRSVATNVCFAISVLSAGVIVFGVLSLDAFHMSRPVANTGGMLAFLAVMLNMRVYSFWGRVFRSEKT